jgi:hypothetical protein
LLLTKPGFCCNDKREIVRRDSFPSDHRQPDGPFFLTARSAGNPGDGGWDSAAHRTDEAFVRKSAQSDCNWFTYMLILAHLPAPY